MSLYWASKGLCISDRDSLECQMRTSFLVPLQVFLDFFLGEVFLEQKIKDVNSMISHDNDISKTIFYRYQLNDVRSDNKENVSLSKGNEAGYK